MNFKNSFTATLCGQQEERISDFKTYSSYRGSGYYCMQGDLIIWNQSHEQFGN